MNRPFNKFHSMTGSALIVSLIILLVMTLLGITAMSTTTLEEKMAGNMRDSNLAFQAAEAALRAGETMANGLSSPCGGPCFSGNADYLADTFWSTNGQAYSAIDVNNTYLAASPLFVIEELDEDFDSIKKGDVETGRRYYRITARGTGGSTTSRVVLQSTYHVKF